MRVCVLCVVGEVKNLPDKSEGYLSTGYSDTKLVLLQAEKV
jgi:hypothetical protein